MTVAGEAYSYTILNWAISSWTWALSCCRRDSVNWAWYVWLHLVVFDLKSFPRRLECCLARPVCWARRALLVKRCKREPGRAGFDAQRSNKHTYEAARWLVARESVRITTRDSRLAIDGHSTHGPHLLHVSVLRCLSQDSTLHTTPNVFLPLIVANINHFPCHRPYRRAKRIRIDSRHRPLSRQDRRFHALCRTSPLCIAVIPLLGLSQRRPFRYSSLSTRSWISISNKLISTTTTTTKFGKLHSEGTQSLVDVELMSFQARVRSVAGTVDFPHAHTPTRCSRTGICRSDLDQDRCQGPHLRARLPSHLSAPASAPVSVNDQHKPARRQQDHRQVTRCLLWLFRPGVSPGRLRGLLQPGSQSAKAAGVVLHHGLVPLYPLCLGLRSGLSTESRVVSSFSCS